MNEKELKIAQLFSTFAFPDSDEEPEQKPESPVKSEEISKKEAPQKQTKKKTVRKRKRKRKRNYGGYKVGTIATFEEIFDLKSGKRQKDKIIATIDYKVHEAPKTSRVKRNKLKRKPRPRDIIGKAAKRRRTNAQKPKPPVSKPLSGSKRALRMKEKIDKMSKKSKKTILEKESKMQNVKHISSISNKRRPTKKHRKSVKYSFDKQNANSRMVQKSKYASVYWVTRDRRWRARIRINGKSHSGGSFQNEFDAAVAVNALCKRIGVPMKNPHIVKKAESLSQKSQKSSLVDTTDDSSSSVSRSSMILKRAPRGRTKIVSRRLKRKQAEKAPKVQRSVEERLRVSNISSSSSSRSKSKSTSSTLRSSMSSGWSSSSTYSRKKNTSMNIHQVLIVKKKCTKTGFTYAFSGINTAIVQLRRLKFRVYPSGIRRACEKKISNLDGLTFKWHQYSPKKHISWRLVLEKTRKRIQKRIQQNRFART